MSEFVYFSIAPAALRVRWLICCAGLVSLSINPSPAAESSSGKPEEIVLVEATMIEAQQVRAWKQEGFSALTVILDERAEASLYRSIARQTAAVGLKLYYWIEVARNPELAERHPRWMASLGMHDDWQRNFPNSPKPGPGQVAKAFPWVPITYREAFDAHLARIERLLQRVPADYRGLLLNDLQAGPSVVFIK